MHINPFSAEAISNWFRDKFRSSSSGTGGWNPSSGISGNVDAITGAAPKVEPSTPKPFFPTQFVEGAMTAAEAAFAREAGFAREMFDKQTDLANTAHQRGVQDLIKAGLNPVLSAGGAQAMTPAGMMAHSSKDQLGDSNDWDKMIQLIEVAFDGLGALNPFKKKGPLFNIVTR